MLMAISLGRDANYPPSLMTSCALRRVGALGTTAACIAADGYPPYTTISCQQGK